MLPALLPLLFALPFGPAVSEILVVIAIILVVFIIFRLGKFLLGLLVNSILGLIAIFLLNAIFGLAIPITLAVIVATAIFGLPAVFVLVILKLGGLI